MDKTSRILFIGFSSILALVIGTLFIMNGLNKSRNEKISKTISVLSQLMQSNQKVNYSIDKIVSYRQFALKEREQTNLKQHLETLTLKTDTLFDLLDNIDEHLAIKQLYSDTLRNNFDEINSSAKSLTNLSSSDFNWEERQDLSSTDLKNMLSNTNRCIVNFQHQLLKQNTLEENENVNSKNWLLFVLVFTILFAIILIIRPSANTINILNHKIRLLDNNNKISNKKNKDLTSKLKLLEEEIIDERNQKMVINKSLEEKNKEINKFREDSDYFSYIVSHDLKAPLKGIDQSIDDIMNEFQSLSEEHLKLLNLSKSRVALMREKINGIMQFATAGKLNGPLQKIYLNQIISEIILKLEDSDKIKFNIQPNLPLLVTDKEALQTVLNNLLENAISFNNSEDPVIEITCKQKVDFYQIKIRDNGIGIHSDYHSIIFDIFKKLESTNKESAGIGLSISRKIILDKGGEIWVESEPNVGSSFYFTWPA